MPSNGNVIQLAIVTMLLVYSSLAFSAEPAWLSPIISDCDAGMTQQCLSVGVAYTKGELRGKKVTKDKAKAKQYIGKAVKRGQQNCLQGDNEDCYTLGLLFFQGGGVVPADIPRGLELLQRACRGGHARACAWLDNSGLGRAPR
jgi:TPR repeat protein